LSRSLRVTIPASLPSESITGRCLTSRRVISRAASVSSVPGGTVLTGVAITSAARVAAALPSRAGSGVRQPSQRPGRRRVAVLDQQVGSDAMLTSRPESSTTGRALRWCCWNSRTSSWNGVAGAR